MCVCLGGGKSDQTFLLWEGYGDFLEQRISPVKHQLVLKTVWITSKIKFLQSTFGLN